MGRRPLPRLSRVEFFRHRDDALASSLAAAIDDHVAQFPDAKLTPRQVAISAWSSAAVDVPNGGFTQFFYNRRGDRGIRELAVLLESLDLSKAAAILRDAAVVYRRHRRKFDVSNPCDGLFGGIDEFDALDRDFEKISLRCGRTLDAWIRSHIAELATDEAGGTIDANFTGTVEIRHPNGQIKESMEVKKGKPHGSYREFFDDGSVRAAAFYKSGKIAGDCWPNGQVKRRESKQGTNRIIEWFYPSGAVQKRYVMDKNGHATEPIRLFHENGQLAELLTTVQGKKRGPWRKFFDDGSPELEAKYVGDEKLVVRNAWNERREPVVQNGVGIFRDYPAEIDWKYDVFSESHWPREAELQDGVPHGKVKTFHDGLLWSVDHFVRGKPDGESTTYWDNGRVRLITQYVRGKAGKSQEFPKFDHPRPAVVLRVRADAKLYQAWRHVPVDEYPRALNLAEVQNQLAVPQFLREVHERNVAGTLKASYEDCNTFNDGIAYLLTVDETGQVTSATGNGSGVYSVGEWDTYVPFLRKLRFAPGRIRGRAVECHVVAHVDHTFVERGELGTK